MKIIDLYIVRRFITWLFLWICVIVILYVIIDLTTNQDYLSVKGDRSTWHILFEFYLYRLVSVIDNFLSMFVLISTMMVINSMILKNELIALQAMGVPYRRLMTPLLIVGLIICGFAFLIREFFVPAHAVQIIQTPQELAENRTEYPVFKMPDSLTHIKIDGQSILPKEGIINEPIVSLPALLSRYGSELTAERAEWHPKDDTFPSGYFLRNIRNPKEILSSPSLDLLGKAHSSTPIVTQTPNEPGDPTKKTPTDSSQTVVLYSPSDTPSLESTDCFIVTGLPPMILASGDNWKSNASTAQLISAAGNPSITAKAAYDIASRAEKDLQFRVHQRILKPVFDILPLLLGLPILFFSANIKPLAGNVNALLVAGVLFLGSSFVIAYLGSRLGSPILGVWIPLFLFVPVVVNFLYDLLYS